MEGESFPRRCSDVEQESMKVWATTDKQASVMLLLWMSNTNWGFLITFTQKRRGRLVGGKNGEANEHFAEKTDNTAGFINLLK